MQSKLSVRFQGLSLGMQALKAAPIQAQTTLLYNPTRNFEVFCWAADTWAAAFDAVHHRHQRLRARIA